MIFAKGTDHLELSCNLNGSMRFSFPTTEQGLQAAVTLRRRLERYGVETSLVEANPIDDTYAKSLDLAMKRGHTPPRLVVKNRENSNTDREEAERAIATILKSLGDDDELDVAA